MSTAEQLPVKAGPTPAKAQKQASKFLAQALSVMDESIRANPDDLEGLVRVHQILEQFAKDVKLLKDDAEQFAVKALAEIDGKKTIIDGLGLVETTYSSKRDYDDDLVDSWLCTVAQDAVVKAEQHGDNPVRAAVRAIRSVLYKSEPKKTALEAHGVDIEKMSTQSWGKRGIKVSMGVMQMPVKRITKGDSKK